MHHLANIAFKIQPVLLRIITGSETTEVSQKYVTCPKFRTAMKAKALGNLMDALDSMEVCTLPFENCILLKLLWFILAIFIIMQINELVTKIEDFVLEKRADHHHPTLTFLDNDLQLFGFVVDILLPKVCTDTITHYLKIFLYQYC